jgi:uncharacterized protein YbjT (DUF2867 family)
MKENLNEPLDVVLMGATGAVGGHALQRLGAMDRIARVTVLARRPLDGPRGAKVKQHLVDVLDPAAYRHLLAGHGVAISAMGVGQPSKASREEFIKVDKLAVLDFATACRDAGIAHFELLGSVAADAASRSFFLKSKGELRDAIAALGFPRFSAFQPSMLITPVNRYGFSQAVMLAAWPLLSPLLVGGLSKYRGIKVETLGAAMAENILKDGRGTEVLHWKEFMKIAGAA